MKVGSGDEASDEDHWFTEVSPVQTLAGAGFFVLLGISAAPAVWIDAAGKSRTTAERNRSDLKGPALSGLAANRRGSVTPGLASHMAFVGGRYDFKDGACSAAAGWGGGG
ncbi:MAG: hypothetical protein HKL82_08830 [Acidimicrobiaceae bacterium]|nr:hypothetical protein [Acidimicrobiaceae bacterium]